jgi:hypothetical protein
MQPHTIKKSPKPWMVGEVDLRYTVKGPPPVKDTTAKLTPTSPHTAGFNPR